MHTKCTCTHTHTHSHTLTQVNLSEVEGVVGIVQALEMAAKAYNNENNTMISLSVGVITPYNDQAS